jgi:hypothetical protein
VRSGGLGGAVVARGARLLSLFGLVIWRIVDEGIGDKLFG